MFKWVVLAAIAASALAQERPEPGVAPVATIPAGVPLRVALERRAAIQRVGESIQGRLADPIYVYDRLALPAGCAVEGHIAEIGGVPVGRRLSALLSGNFTPRREVRAQFDTLVLSDGERLPLSTSLSFGTAHTSRIGTDGGRKKESRAPVLQDARNRLAGVDRAFTAPGKMSRLKSRLFEMLPYHRQAWTAGTMFNSVLQAPLPGVRTSPAEARTGSQPEAQELTARLLAPLSSATARRGASVEAVVTRPLFSNDHRLLIPEGSRVLGEVVEARPARYFHRSGKLLFVFREIKPASGAAQGIHGYVEGVEADFDAHLALDAEGATRVASPATRFIFPAISAAVAGLSFHQDYNAQGVADRDIGGRAESGAIGLGLIGTLVAQAGGRGWASGIAIAGAGFSVYSTFLARGQNVVLPLNTPVQISLGARDGAAPGSGSNAPAAHLPR
jgi:hypothetical protein